MVTSESTTQVQLLAPLVLLVLTVLLLIVLLALSLLLLGRRSKQADYSRRARGCRCTRRVCSGPAEPQYQNKNPATTSP